VIFHYHIWKVVHDPLRIDQKFLFHFFLWDTEQVKADRGAGTTMIHVSKGSMDERDILLPPLPEQHRIVAILDEAFDGIATAKANAEKNLQNARALFESHLESVLRSKAWTWKTLGDLCDGVEYGSSAKSQKEGRVPVLRMGNIQDGQFDWGNLVYSDDEDEIAKYLLKPNDVLFNRTNSPELVGKTAIYKGEMPAIFAGYLIRIRRKEDLLDGDFLSYFLNSQIALDHGKTVVISSVNQANINGAKLKGYPIPAPSLQDQRIIVKKLNGMREETQRLASLYQRKLAALDELKRSLLHQAFSGAL
jgi:type I restriction enzyme S subunit